MHRAHIHVLLVRSEDVLALLLEDLAYRLQCDVPLRHIDELTRFEGLSGGSGDTLRSV
jgi:hypothetical protein